MELPVRNGDTAKLRRRHRRRRVAAAARKIIIVGASIHEKASGKKVFNTCCVIGTEGQILAKHRKLHLFEIDIPGDITLKESDTFTGGQEATTVDTVTHRLKEGWNLPKKLQLIL